MHQMWNKIQKLFGNEEAPVANAQFYITNITNKMHSMWNEIQEAMAYEEASITNAQFDITNRNWITKVS